MKPLLILLAIFLPQKMLQGQATTILPSATAYALPAEGEDGQNPRLYNSEHSILNWFNPKQTIHYFFYVKETGTLNITIELGSSHANGQIKWTCNGQQKILGVPKGDAYRPQKVNAGVVTFSKPGFYELILSCVKMAGKQPPNVGNILLIGKIAGSIHANQQPRKNAASVHLSYPLPDSTEAIGFYNELTIPKGFDPLYTYYMACGFKRGYFGMQVNSPTERRIIFSVWDSGNEPDDRTKVKDEDKVQLTGYGAGVIANGFGNEGTGGHSHWVYHWKTDSTYRFYVTALPDSNATYYSGYFFVPELQQWKLIASFKAPKDGTYLQGLYSFVENFDGKNGQLQRKATLDNQWIQTEDRNWKELTKATFTYDATGKAGDRIDYEAGSANQSFYLANGGFKPANVAYADTFSRVPHAIAPIIDLYKNADSSLQAAKEKQQIFAAVAAGQLDTTASIQGMYYHIIKEGTGRNVRVSDTVVAYYKGAILGGAIFDQTKTEPATFPLARLVKGWQIGVPMCKVGGTIRLIIPSALGYSIRTRSAKIPPNSVLVFDIEVRSVK